MTSYDALVKAVRVLGGQVATARVCGVKQQHVYNWLNRDMKLPPQHALKVQHGTQQAGDPVLAADLCPEVFTEVKSEKILQCK